MKSMLKELWAYMRVRKKWWLLPVLVILLAMGTFITLAEGTAAVPFLYTVF